MTAVETPARDRVEPKEQQPIAIETGWRERINIWWIVAAIIVAWIVVWSLTKGHDTLTLGDQDSTSIHNWFNARRDDIQFANQNNFWIQLTNGISDHLNSLFATIQHWISIPAPGNVVPDIGWLGVVGIAGWIALALAGWRISIFVMLCMTSFGVLNFWSDSMDLLIVTLISSAIAVVIGVPVSLWMGNSKTATAIVNPILDFFQTFPASSTSRRSSCSSGWARRPRSS